MGDIVLKDQFTSDARGVRGFEGDVKDLSDFM